MELYIKTIEDPGHDADQVHIQNEIVQLITQIETMLFTDKGTVLGEPEFGASLETLIYELDANEEQIISLIQEQLSMYIPLSEKYDTSVNVTFQRGEIRDAANLNITIDGQYLVEVKTQ
jgi:phage baseplate assembly protein W